MQFVLVILVAVATTTIASPVRRARSIGYHHSYPQIYEEPIQTVYNYEPHSTHIESIEDVHDVHSHPTVLSVYETRRTLPAVTTTQTQVHTAATDVYHVSVPVTYTQTVQSPTRYHTYTYNDVHVEPEYNSIGYSHYGTGAW